MRGVSDKEISALAAYSDTMMAGVLFGVSDAEIQALAHFLGGSRQSDFACGEQ